MIKKGVILGIFYFLISSCNLFPGFFLPWANQNSGIGGGNWQDVGDTSVMLILHPNYTDMLDMDVADNGDVLLGMIDSASMFPNIYEYKPGGNWNQLGGGLPYINNLVYKEAISVCYMVSNTIPVPHVTFYDSGATNRTFLFEYKPQYNSWQSYPTAQYNEMVKVELIPSLYENYTDTRLMVGVSNSMNRMYFFSSAFNANNFSYAGSFDRLSICHNYENNEVIAGIGDLSGFDIISYPIGGTPVIQLSVYNLDQGIFSVEASGMSVGRMIYMAILSNNQMILARDVSGMRTLVGSIPVLNIKDLDTAYDYARHRLYLAIADSNGFIQAYAYDEASDVIRTLGGQIQGIDARVIRLEHREGSSELYLAFGDGNNQGVRVMKIVD